MAKLKRGDIIEIEWLDAWSNSHGRYNPHYHYAAIPMKDVGYLIEENDRGILMSHCNQESGKCFVGETFTPWEMIKSVEILDG